MTTAHAPRGKGALALRTTGELLITLGVLTLLLVVYLLYWTDYLNSRTQSRLRKELTQTWSAPGADPAVVATPPGTTAEAASVKLPNIKLGTALGIIYMPRLGSPTQYHEVMVQGTDEGQLQLGAGHYVQTVMPGLDGNFSVAGHRTTYGKPFNRLAEMKTGDHVVIETKSEWVTYVVTGEDIIQSNDQDGYPITPKPPSIGNQQGSKKLLTFTTCNPEYSAAQRLILRGIWVSTDLKKDHPANWTPPALAKGLT